MAGGGDASPTPPPPPWIRHYNTTQLLEHKSNMSKQWAVINDLLGKTTNQNNAIRKMLKHDKQMTKI